MPEEPISIACAADDNFAMPMAVMAFSVLDNLDPAVPIHFYLMDGGISDRNKSLIESIIRKKSSLAEVRWLYPPERFANGKWNTQQGLSDATLLCLFLPNLLPPTVEQVIYLDCDLILNTSIARLWQKNIADYTLLAVQDFAAVNVSSQYGIPVYQELGLAPSTPYFNAGVLVINCNKWKQEKIGEKAASYLQTYKEVQRFNDQEALNAILKGEFGHLSLRWNQQTILFRSARNTPPFSHLTKEQFQALKGDPHIIHFTEHPNPWIGDCANPQKWVFVDYLRRSGWYTRREWIKFKVRYDAHSLRQYIYERYRYFCDISRPIRKDLTKKIRHRVKQT